MDSNYKTYPFRTAVFGSRRLVTNDIGEYHFLSEEEHSLLDSGHLDQRTSLFLDLKAKQFVSNGPERSSERLAEIRKLTKKAAFEGSVCLHMVVPTIRCNCRCTYCQVSSFVSDKAAPSTDMSLSTAKRVVDIIHESPRRGVKVEFQGGEALLNLDLVEFILKYGAAKRRSSRKEIEYVLCTNLVELPPRALRLLARFSVAVSTSLDGPRDIHETQRPHAYGGSSYQLLLENLAKARQHLGHDRVSALSTVTATSLERIPEIIDEYRRLGFSTVFLRPLNPFGRASPSRFRSYTEGAFVKNYLDALGLIIGLNLRGERFVDVFAQMLVRRMLTPFGDAYVDFQSPSGAGTLCAIYNHDGNVYASDEGRMLAETGDRTFLLGNVRDCGFDRLFRTGLATRLAAETSLERRESCAKCAFLPFCGSDPVRDYAASGSPFGSAGSPANCAFVKPVFMYLFRILMDDDARADVLWSWASDRSLSEVRL